MGDDADRMLDYMGLFLSTHSTPIHQSWPPVPVKLTSSDEDDVAMMFWISVEKKDNAIYP